MSKKSITASFGLLAAGIDANEAADVTPATVPATPRPSPLPRVGAGVIGAADRSIGALRAEHDRLAALLASGGGASSELDPALVDPSPFPDRLPDDGDAGYLEFRQTIETEGQRVPIQVRPHPNEAGRYQVVYGHRRLRAAKELSRPVKAIVVEMSDREMVVSQGLENASRQDLTWIERTLFARRMDDAGLKARDIRSALSIDDPELARMRSVYRAVPLELIERIGRAPKVGRPRWVDFSRRFSLVSNSEERVLKTLSADKVLKLSSDERFRLAFDALKASNASNGEADSLDLIEPGGEPLGVLKVSDKGLRLIASTARGRSFSAFLQAEMPRLIERFVEEDGQG
ncbi:plasmid partitioning protein RepB [Rhizobium cremeum]|uniref:plasmid partitioning protein RepB n=1 Tax=Rhizobium cremeum TaxID=2813827 RepID=UPI000DD7BDA3|nr:plasmid partitioning protein RepB [Rhizobium cremeum]MCJ7995732.1 plasmid partitioning protein RepB [Rhizobium cremeum]MCJ8001230.1 plasmid partitioning protein RepB [Rhizobium cremeum]